MKSLNNTTALCVLLAVGADFATPLAFAEAVTGIGEACTPLSQQYPDMGTTQSTSANKEFITIWGSFRLPGGPCGYASAEAHYNALLDDARSRGGPTDHRPETLPDWGGHWGTDINTGEVVIGGIHSSREGVLARLTPAARVVYERDVEMLHAEQGIDPISLCLPLNFPRWFTPYGYREHFLTPGKSLLGSEMMNEFRRIFTDGRAHPTEEWMTKEWLGYSIGFWDNDILVVWTRGIKKGIMTRGMPRLTDKVEVVASRDVTKFGGEFSFSRSLLAEASSGHIARLSRTGGQSLGQSIERLGIVGAVCAPIVLDASVIGYIYLDYVFSGT